MSSECDRCSYYAHSRYVVCALHPAGPTRPHCPDFDSAELWEPEDPAIYGEWVKEMLWHPLFTGRCPECRRPFSRFKLPPVTWQCSACGWQEDEEG